MTRSRISWGAVAVLVVGALLILLRQGPDLQTVRLPLETAGGLRTGSQVKVAGVPVGEISDLALGDRDRPLATLEVDPNKAKVGRDASAEIVTSNLLGSKFINIEPGKQDTGETVTLSEQRVTYPTDVDELLGTLDADTRTRLQILLNELGFALTGRRADFREAMRLLPRDLDVGADLLAELAADNETLGQLVEDAGRSVNLYTRERDQLTRMIDTFAGTLETTADRRAQLSETLREAPSTLRTAQTFLADLERTAEPLGPAARTLAATAPALQDTLAQVPAFERAARPALDRAVAVAPLLTRLGVEATPTLRRAAPTLRRLARFSEDVVPAVDTLRASVDDTLGTLEGWARAIQSSDGFSHVFRGRLTFGAEFFRSIIAAQGGPSLVRSLRTSTRRRERQAPPVVPATPDAGPAPGPVPDRLPPLLDQVTSKLRLPETVQKPVDDVTGALDGVSKQAAPLLDYLLRP